MYNFFEIPNVVGSLNVDTNKGHYHFTENVLIDCAQYFQTIRISLLFKYLDEYLNVTCLRQEILEKINRESLEIFKNRYPGEVNLKIIEHIMKFIE